MMDTVDGAGQTEDVIIGMYTIEHQGLSSPRKRLASAKQFNVFTLNKVTDPISIRHGTKRAISIYSAKPAPETPGITSEPQDRKSEKRTLGRKDPKIRFQYLSRFTRYFYLVIYPVRNPLLDTNHRSSICGLGEKSLIQSALQKLERDILREARGDVEVGGKNLL